MEARRVLSAGAAADPARRWADWPAGCSRLRTAGRAPALDQTEELDARALPEILAAPTELDDLGQPPERAELIELLETLEHRPAPPRGEETVLLAEPLEVRARRFRAVFVCGLQEGEFPRPASPEPFLSNKHRFELAAAGGPRLRAREDTLAAERYLFYGGCSRATERVFLAYRSSDEEGNLALPSPFIADVAELLGCRLGPHAPAPAAGRRRVGAGPRSHRARARPCPG